MNAANQDKYDSVPDCSGTPPHSTVNCRERTKEVAGAGSLASHTPGPWQCDEPANWHGLAARVCTSKYEPIAQVQFSGWPRRTAIANTNLVAAAPDLLAVLCTLIEQWSSIPETVQVPDEINVNETWAAAIAAIAKARGVLA